MTVRKILTLALAEIEKRGWCQPGRLHEGYPGQAYSPETRPYHGVCAHHAILEFAAGRAGAEAVKALSLTVVPDGRGTSIEIVCWNDARGRTLAEVRAAFAKAMERA